MLEARSVALVGASPRPGSLGARMIAEVAKSPAAPRTYLVNPRYEKIGTERVYPSLASLPEPAELALLAVPDTALEEQMGAAAQAGIRSAVVLPLTPAATGYGRASPRPRATPRCRCAARGAWGS